MVFGRIKVGLRYRGNTANLWAVEDLPRIKMANQDLQYWFTNFLAHNMKWMMEKRAPVFTGYLKSSIQFKEIKNIKSQSIVHVAVRAAYAFYQEEGYTPHFIPMDYILQHYNRPGAPGTYVENPKWIQPVLYTPFVTPAYVFVRKKYEYIARQAWNKSFPKKTTDRKLLIAG